jgi:multidrug efflux pump subunit AcrA (membrane-fusion protein)
MTYQTINLVIDANQQSTTTGVLAFITPQTDDSVDDHKTPVVRLRVGVTNKLDGKIVHGPIDFASVAAGDMNKVVCKFGGVVAFLSAWVMS